MRAVIMKGVDLAVDPVQPDGTALYVDDDRLTFGDSFRLRHEMNTHDPIAPFLRQSV